MGSKARRGNSAAAYNPPKKGEKVDLGFTSGEQSGDRKACFEEIGLVSKE